MNGRLTLLKLEGDASLQLETVTLTPAQYLAASSLKYSKHGCHRKEALGERLQPFHHLLPVSRLPD